MALSTVQRANRGHTGEAVSQRLGQNPDMFDGPCPRCPYHPMTTSALSEISKRSWSLSAALDRIEAGSPDQAPLLGFVQERFGLGGVDDRNVIDQDQAIDPTAWFAGRWQAWALTRGQIRPPDGAWSRGVRRAV